MGRCSTLFYNQNDPDKQTLHRRVIPTDEQYKEQEERWNALAEYLKSDLKEKSGYLISTWLQGSYKFGTQVRPLRSGQEFDIDLGIYFDWEGKPTDGRFTAKEIKALVQQRLKAYRDDEVLNVAEPPKARCARIKFKGDFHIDVPSYHRNPTKDQRALATESNVWEDSDPKALYLWFKNKFDDARREKVRRYVRYIKCWVGLKFSEDEGRPSSILVTVLVAESVVGLTNVELASDDEALSAIITIMLDRLLADGRVKNPVDSNENLAARMTPQHLESFKEKLRIFSSIAQSAINIEELIAAADKWAEAFEHFFPLPEQSDIAKYTEAVSSLPVPVAVPEVSVRAVSRDNSNLNLTSRNGLGPIPRNCDIYFQLLNPQAFPFGSTFEWVVRNEGDEAEYKNDLGHRAGMGINVKESSSYKGTHYMDCVVKQFGRLFAVRRIPVKIDGSVAQRRNPPRRKFWVRELTGRK